MAVSRVTQQEAALHLGLSVSGLKQVLGRLGFPSKGFDLDELRLAYLDDLRETASGRNKKYVLEQERARLAHHQANKTALEEEILEGTLVPVDLVKDKWRDRIAAARAKLLGLPNKAAPAIVGEKKIATVQNIIKRYIYEALDELAGEDEKGPRTAS
ncbi:MAG: hypothetical protein AAF542_17885 [Pseudomonadota bacterium]